VDVREQAIIPLGYGKYVRSDKIVALDPIDTDRGPGRRTRVYVEQLPAPIIASRTESSILASIVKTPPQMLEAAAAFDLLQDLLDDVEQVGSMLRKSIKDEAGLDLDDIERRIRGILSHEFVLE